MTMPTALQNPTAAPLPPLPSVSAPTLAAFLALMAGATCIGFSGIMVRFADVGPAAVGFWRMVFALPLLVIWMAAEGRGPRARSGALWPIGLAGLAFGFDVVLYNASLGHTTIANASLLGNLSPIAVILGAWAILGERPTRRVVGALALALAGGLALILPKLAGGAPTGGGLFGDGLATGAALAYALYIIAVRRARDATGTGRIAFLSSSVCAAFCLAAALALGETLWPTSLQGWLALIGLGVVSHALGQGLITLSLGSFGAGAASLVMVWPSLVGILAAWAIFSEAPGPAQLLGGVAILGAVMLVRRG